MEALANVSYFGVSELREEELLVTYVLSKSIDAVIENPEKVVEGTKKALEQEAKPKPITIFYGA